MIKILKNRIKKNFEIFGLFLLILITILSTTYFNHKKNDDIKTYNNFISNIYFKKTLENIINNLDPKYKKISHKIQSGETFDKILEGYSIEKKEIIKIKKILKKIINLNKLSTKQIIEFSIDKTNNKIKEFTFQISNTEKINLKRNTENDKFQKEILYIKLDKKIIYKENIILQSLYKSANEQNIPPNIILLTYRI